MIWRTQTNDKALFELVRALSPGPALQEFRLKVLVSKILERYGDSGGATMPTIQRAILRIGLDAYKANCTEVHLVLELGA